MAKRTGTKKASSKKMAAQKKPAAQKPETPKAPDTPRTPRDDSHETVVFAIRLKRSERDLIHKAAGSGKASAFVRGLAVAAAQGNLTKVKEIVEVTRR